MLFNNDGKCPVKETRDLGLALRPPMLLDTEHGATGYAIPQPGTFGNVDVGWGDGVSYGSDTGASVQ
jgi:hypothetical protein